MGNTPAIARSVATPCELLLAWLAGGLIALLGAFCYAELATTYPKEGGDYVYLTQAFGQRAGFLFSWAQLWVVRPGSIGLLAYIFSRYANHLVPLNANTTPVAYAAAPVILLTLVNISGVRQGVWTQNTLTIIKILGILLVSIVALLPFHRSGGISASGKLADPTDFKLAIMLVLFTYGGWNDMCSVAGEVRHPEHNLSRSLLLGILIVTGIYLLVNLSFLHALGLSGMRNSSAVAVDVLEVGFGSWGGLLVSLIICASCLGAINGQILTGSRIYYATGTEHPIFFLFGRWHPHFGTPLSALLLQAVITVVAIIGFGLNRNGFARLVIFTTPVFWTFFFLVGLSLIVLRHNRSSVSGSYRVPLYPITPLLFSLSSFFVLTVSLLYAYENSSLEAAWSLGILGVGFLLSFWKHR